MKKEIKNEDKLRLLMSSLFARKMPFAVFTDTSKDYNDMFFTNVSEEDILIYTPNTENYIHRVIVKDEGFMQWFFETFPALTVESCILYIRPFLAALNKTKSEYKDLKLEIVGSKLFLTTEESGKVDCGTILGPEVLSIYGALFYRDDQHKAWIEHHKEDPVDKKQKKLGVIEIDANVDKEEHPYDVNKNNLVYRILIEPGKNIPHLEEYIRRAKDPCVVRLQYKLDKQALWAKYICISDFVEVQSVCPDMYWFPRNLIRKDIKNG